VTLPQVSTAVNDVMLAMADADAEKVVHRVCPALPWEPDAQYTPCALASTQAPYHYIQTTCVLLVLHQAVVVRL
jgi:hypothetical protein